MTSKPFSKILAAFGFYVNFAHFIYVSPYRFDSAEQKLVFDNRLRYKIGLCFHILLLLSYDTFIALQCVRALKDSAFDSYSELRLLHYARIFGVLSPSVVLAIAQFGTHAELVNSLLKVRKDLKKKHGLEAGTKATKWIFRLAVTFGILCPAAFSRGVVKNWKRPHLISSVLVELPKIAIAPIMAFQSLVFFSALFSDLFAVLMVLLFLEVTLPAVELSRVRGQRRDPNSIRSIFTLLAVLERIFASILGPWTLLIVAVALSSITFSILQGLIFGEWTTSGLAVVVLSLLKLYTRACSAMHESSEDVMQTWEPLRIDPAFSKWRRSCKPLRVTIGSFFYFDRTIMLTFLDIIVSNAVNIMLSYR